MQVHNFYDDPVPSVRNPLNSIALSPDAMRFNSYSLRNAQDDYGDFQSVLPSPNSCLLHGEAECRRPAWLINLFQRRRHRSKSDHHNASCTKEP